MQVNLHEGSHALAAMSLGYHVDTYKPWPHFVDIDGQSHLVGGEFAIREDDAAIPRADYAWISIAPFVTDLLLFLASDLALEAVPADSYGAPFLAFGGMMFPLPDFAAGILFRTSETDIMKFHQSSGVPSWVSFLVGGALIVVGSWRLGERLEQMAQPHPGNYDRVGQPLNSRPAHARLRPWPERSVLTVQPHRTPQRCGFCLK